MSRVIAVANQKGGAGKTTTALTLGAALARFHGKGVLLVDADAQASLTIAAGMDQDIETTLSDMLNGADAEPMSLGTYKRRGRLDLIPGDAGLSLLEDKLKHLDAIGRALEPIKGGYDYVLIDCQPTLTPLTLSSIAAADETIIPALPHYLYLRGIENILDTIKELNDHGAAIQRARVLFTQADNTRNTRAMIESTRKGADVFSTVIRRNVAIPEAQGAGVDIYEGWARSNGAKDYKALADEIIRD